MHDELEARIEATAALLREAVGERWISGDGRVSEETAAELLDVAPATLAKWRQTSIGPAFYRLGTRGGKTSYRLLDLAAFIEARRGG